MGMKAIQIGKKNPERLALSVTNAISIDAPIAQPTTSITIQMTKEMLPNHMSYQHVQYFCFSLQIHTHIHTRTRYNSNQ